MEQNSKERVSEFLKTMLDWECRLQALRRSAQYRDVEEIREKAQESAKLELIEIFDKHLTIGAIKRYGDRLKALPTQFPPEFDQEILPEYEEDDGVATVYANLNDRLTEKRRYQLILYENCWRISEVSVWRRSREKWEANILI
jgi:hypothetical protein